MKALALLLLPLSAIAEPHFPTQSEVQAQFDAYVAKTDAMEVLAFNRVEPANGGHGVEMFTPLWRTHDTHDIRSLSTYFRLNVRAPVTEVVDGKPTEVYRGFSVGSFPQFKIVLKHGNDVLIEFLVWKSCIGTSQLPVGGGIEVDQQALAPFYLRVTQMGRRQPPDQRRGK